MKQLAALDWVVLIGTIAAIVLYGAWRARGVRDVDSYVRGSTSLRWPTIGLTIMATQASAITFISTPAQGYSDGMRFVQFYFGLPIAMIVISAVFVPVYLRLNVRTAYEYLEHRFDLRVRIAGGVLFLIGRGLSTGITIYAPSIILSQILGWPLHATIWAMGIVVVLYTVLGGNLAVSFTQKQQMVVMLTGLAVAATVVILRLPDEVSVPDAVHLAGALGRMNVLTFDLNFNDRYNFWSGLAGGFFIALSYFGTDQSQVQRYLSGQSVAESRIGLLFNGIFKVPMQFLILFTGVMVFVFYVFTRPPVHFDHPTLALVEAQRAAEVATLNASHDQAFAERRDAAFQFLATRGSPGEKAAREALVAAEAKVEKVHGEAKQLIERTLPNAASRDNDYVFLSFVLDYLPLGLVGLLIAVILCAAMSAIASGLIALGASTTVDFYLRIRQELGHPPPSAHHGLRISQLATIAWAAISIVFASIASLFANLIEAVNIIGSIFYGTILGLFVVALFLRRVTATPVLIGAGVAQTLVLVLHFWFRVGFLWYNVIGCAAVVVVSLAMQAVLPPPRAAGPELPIAIPVSKRTSRTRRS
jgi:solute:Na+ symporter, SSS family